MTTHSESDTLWVGITSAGRVRLCGRDRADLLNRLSTNDVARLATARATFSTVFTNEKGRVVDWVVVYVRDDALWLRTSVGRAASVRAWIDRYTIMEDVRADADEAPASLLVATGPQAARALGGLSVEAGRYSDVWGGMLSLGPAAYGERLELWLPEGEAAQLSEAAVARGAQRADAMTLEVLRLRAGVPSPEHEFKDEVNPLELRLGSVAVSFTKGCYVGQEIIARMDAYDKLARVLMGFEADIPVSGADLRLQRDGRPLGRVTSVARDERGTTLGLAVVRRETAQPGPAELTDGSRSVAARLVDRPFWRP